MKFKDIFKSRDQRRSEELERQNNFERVSDFTEKLHHNTFKYINFYYEHNGINEAVKAIEIWKSAISEIHKIKIEHAPDDRKTEIRNNLLMKEFNKFNTSIEQLDRDLKEKYRDGLRDLKYELIKRGDMDVADKYLFMKRKIFIEEVMLFARNDLTLASIEISNSSPENEKLQDIEYLVNSLKNKFHQNRST